MNIFRNNSITSKEPVSYIPREVGTVFEDTFERASLGSNWTEVGGISTTMDGSDMIISGGSANYAVYNKYTAWGTCLENWVLTCEFEADTQSIAVEGITMGIKTNSAFGNRSIV